MAPKKKATNSAASVVTLDEPINEPIDVAVEEIEEITPLPEEEPRTVTFVLGSEAALGGDGAEEEDDDDEDYSEGEELVTDDDDDDEGHDPPDDELTTAIGQLTQLMMTEEGEAITDVILGVREAMDKQNKILYRGLQLLEQRFGRR